MKRISSLFLALTLCLGLAVPASAAENAGYTDLEAHYAKAAVETWSGYDVLKGYPDGSFKPNDPVTRAEMAVVLDRVMGYQATAENTFSDVPDRAWYAQSVLHLVAEGIFQGRKAGQMMPNAPITRQEALAALARAMAVEESGEAPGFADDGAVSSWAMGDLAAMKAAGYIQGDKNGNVRPDDPITRAELVTILDRMVSGFINADGEYTEDCGGNLVVNAQDVRLKDMTIDGDLIVADGVGEGDVYIEGVTVKGNIILRGCGENSFHILPGCDVKNIIVTKTTGGMIRLVNESGKTIPMIFVNDGKAGVTLDGDELGEVVIACDAPVTVAAKSVKTLSVTKDAKLTVNKGSTVSSLELAETAKDAQVTVEGRVSKLTNDAGVKVDKQNGGSVGGSSSGGSSLGGGSSSGGSGGGSTTAPKTVSEVTLQLLAPAFGNIPDEADVLGVGYSAKTEWFNADGSEPSYRWKADSTAKDTFTADQAYQAVVKLSPVTNYVFADSVKVNVTDGNGNEFVPAKSEKSGNDWVVTMVYEKTEHREPVSGVTVVAPAAVSPGTTAKLEVSYWNNFLVDPETFSYRWYRCDNAEGGGKIPITGATAREYTVPAEDTRTEGILYYCCDVTAGGKTCPSAVKAVEIRDILDADTIPIPTVGSELTVDESGRRMTVELGELMCHKDVSYSVEVNAKVQKKDGTELGGSVTVVYIDSDTIPENGAVSVGLDLVDFVSEYVFTMLRAGLCYDIELGEVTVTVRPALQNAEVADKVGERKLDMTGKGVFHVFSTGSGSADEPWQGPPKSLQLVINGSTGTFQDKTDPDPVPTGVYEQVRVAFYMGTGWVTPLPSGQDSYWNGALPVPENWLEGFGTGESMAQVICAFYALGEPGEGMKVYGMELTNLNIIFQPGNS